MKCSDRLEKYIITAVPSPVGRETFASNTVLYYTHVLLTATTEMYIVLEVLRPLRLDYVRLSSRGYVTAALCICVD